MWLKRYINPGEDQEEEGENIYRHISDLVSNHIFLRFSVPSRWRFLPLILSKAKMRGFSSKVVEGLFAISPSAILVVKLNPSRRMRESGREREPR